MNTYTTKVWKLRTNLTDDQNKQIIKNISQEDSNLLSSLDISVSVDLLDEMDMLHTVMVANIITVEKLKLYLNRLDIEYDFEDITEIFIEGIENEKIEEVLSELTTELVLQKFGIETLGNLAPK
jgi:hypothetical protein